MSVLLCNVKMSNQMTPLIYVSQTAAPSTSFSSSHEHWFSACISDRLSCSHTDGLFCSAEQQSALMSINHLFHYYIVQYIPYTLFIWMKYSSFRFTRLVFVTAGGVTLLWPWVLSSYITVQPLQPLELFHGFNFLFPWLNLKLYLWKQPAYPPCT